MVQKSCDELPGQKGQLLLPTLIIEQVAAITEQ